MAININIPQIDPSTVEALAKQKNLTPEQKEDFQKKVTEFNKQIQRLQNSLKTDGSQEAAAAQQEMQTLVESLQTYLPGVQYLFKFNLQIAMQNGGVIDSGFLQKHGLTPDFTQEGVLTFDASRQGELKQTLEGLGYTVTVIQESGNLTVRMLGMEQALKLVPRLNPKAALFVPGLILTIRYEGKVYTIRTTRENVKPQGTVDVFDTRAFTLVAINPDTVEFVEIDSQFQKNFYGMDPKRQEIIHQRLNPQQGQPSRVNPQGEVESAALSEPRKVAIYLGAQVADAARALRQKNVQSFEQDGVSYTLQGDTVVARGVKAPVWEMIINPADGTYRLSRSVPGTFTPRDAMKVLVERSGVKSSKN